MIETGNISVLQEGGTLQNSKKNQKLNHLEDLALKSAAAYFGEELIHWLGIKEMALRSAPTELVELETRHMYEDFLYEMENGIWYHFEFESDSITKEDLKRFREYEASTSRKVHGPVVTYVICSSKVKKIRDSITEGINTYRVKIIRLKDEIAQEVLSDLSARSVSGLTRADIIPLLLSPLMAGKEDQKDRILQGIKILKNSENTFDKIEIQKMEAILYAFAVKFLSKNDLEIIKEAIAMTKLGEMIWDDGLKEGIEQGKQMAAERYSRLILLLSKEQKEDLIIKAASDPEYREELYKKYNL